ncbi:MAG: DUF308 domain-containing protein [Saprospiraceae bacterium]|nr:DUF308 domain-containing protein [Saprospiraceae bacterium]
MNTTSFINQSAYAVRHWWASMLLGILFIVTGFLVLRTPVESYMALAMLFSVAFVANGILEIYMAVSERKETRGWGWILAGGIIDLLIGIMLVSNPLLSMTVLPFVVGFGLMFRSMMAIGVSINLQILAVKNWGWLLFFGIAGLLFSFFLLRYPVYAGLTVVVWTAMAFFSIGIFRIWLAFQLRQLKKQLSM